MRVETEDSLNDNRERFRSALSGEDVGAERKAAAVEAADPSLVVP